MAGASLETLDDIRDRLTNNGLGNSGLQDQAIGRANLASLNEEVGQSQAAMQNQQARRLYDLQRQLAQRVRSNGPTADSEGPLFDPNKLFSFGKTKGDPISGGSRYAIGMKDKTGKFSIQSVEGNSPLLEVANKNPLHSGSIPEINTQYMTNLGGHKFDAAQIINDLGSGQTNLQGNNLEEIIKRLTGSI